MNFRPIAAAILWVGAALTVPARAQSGLHFPAPTPIADANPDVRHDVVVQIPANLAITRTADSLSIATDRTKSNPATISVGQNMITGLESRLFAYPKDGPRPPKPGGHGLGGTDFNIGTSILNTKTDGIPVPGKSYVVEIEWTIFETDVPPQHHWLPKSGKYKVILEGTLKQIVDP